MVRNYVSKNKRGVWKIDTMKAAANAVLNQGVSLQKAAKEYQVPRTTLRRHLKKGGSIKKQLGRRTVLTEEQETELKAFTLDMERRLFGLTLKDIRRLVFQFCEARKIPHPFNKTEKIAGKDWAKAFMKRHADISLRAPEATSMARAIGFNKTKVKRYFGTLGGILIKDGRRIIPDANIYNVDESGYSICHKPSKIIAQKGKRGVGALTSAENGKTITAVCCVSALGNYIPPMIIFPRVRMKTELMDNAILGAIGRSSKSGWINEELFTDWFDHFVETVRPKTRQDPTLLIMDGHSSHTKNLNLIHKAEANNVILLSLPSHCTHKLQPLDRTFFKSLNSHYNNEVQAWLRIHPGRILTEYQVPELLNKVYGKAATIDIAVNGFRKCGIAPFRPDIFTDEDFIAAEISGFDDKNENPAAGVATETSTNSETDLPQQSVPCEAVHQQKQNMQASTDDIEYSVSFEELLKKDNVSPISTPGNKRKRNVNHSEVLTSSP